ncbi:MAG: FecR domain-containing protein [Myxococcota bacterium]
MSWRERLEDPVDEESIHRIWRGIETRRALRPSLRWQWPALGLAAAIGVLTLVLWPGEQPGPLTPNPEPATAHITGALTFDDGSRITPVEGASVQVLENSGEAWRGIVSEGLTQFEITPNGPRRWTVEAGIARVEVVGTAFAVERRPNSVRISVDRGRVRVVSRFLSEGSTYLDAGQSVEVIEPAEAPSQPADDVAPPSEETPRVRPRSAPSFSDRLEDADDARADGDNGRAERILLEALAAAPEHPQRGLAWFTVGRVRLATHNFRGASSAFDRALRENVPAALREEATIRKTEALYRAGDIDAATRSVADHAARFPDSPRGAEIEAFAADE